MEKVYLTNEEKDYILNKWNGKEPVVLGCFEDYAPKSLGVLVPMQEWNKYIQLKKDIVKMGVEVMFGECKNFCGEE